VVMASEVAEQVQDLSDKVLAGELSRADAAVCGQLLNVKLRALEVGRKLREAEDLEQRLDELEALIAARREPSWGA
jgi:glutathione S-transferase